MVSAMRGNRQQARNTRHAELRQGHAQLHRRAHAAETAGRVTDDARRPPEILLEKMVEQVLERRRNAVIIFRADDQEAVDAAVELRSRSRVCGASPAGCSLYIRSSSGS